MDEALINNWNAKIQQRDHIYILGDVFFCPVDKALRIMNRLNGYKLLVLGNHDKIIRNQVQLQEKFNRILPDLYQETIDKIPVIMCHYPLLSWNRAFHGSFMLHGHCHNRIPHNGKYRRYDVGVDANNYAPIEWSEIKRQLESIDPKDSRDR